MAMSESNALNLQSLAADTPRMVKMTKDSIARMKRHIDHMDRNKGFISIETARECGDAIKAAWILLEYLRSMEKIAKYAANAEVREVTSAKSEGTKDCD